MYFPIISVWATFLNDTGFRSVPKGHWDGCLVNVDESHSRISESFTESKGATFEALQERMKIKPTFLRHKEGPYPVLPVVTKVLQAVRTSAA